VTDLEVELVEPAREVVEVVEQGERVLYVVEPTAAASVPSVLADLDDVSAAVPAAGQGLAWSGAEWAPATISAGGADLTELEGRVDVLEARPVVDSPDDIGAQPVGDYATATELTDGLAGKAATGHTHPPAARVVSTPVTLVDQATIATDAALGNSFRVTLAGNRALGVPTNPADGQRCTWLFTQDGIGNRTITLPTTAGGFQFGSDITSLVLSTAGGKSDMLAAEYHAGRDRWLVLATAKGY
jgi:hypothetical protein